MSRHEDSLESLNDDDFIVRENVLFTTSQESKIVLLIFHIFYASALAAFYHIHETMNHSAYSIQFSKVDDFFLQSKCFSFI